MTKQEIENERPAPKVGGRLFYGWRCVLCPSNNATFRMGGATAHALRHFRSGHVERDWTRSHSTYVITQKGVDDAGNAERWGVR